MLSLQPLSPEVLHIQWYRWDMGAGMMGQTRLDVDHLSHQSLHHVNI